MTNLTLSCCLLALYLTLSIGIVSASNSITPTGRANWEHMSLGIYLYPHVWLKAIHSARYQQNGRINQPILTTADVMEKRYGMKPSNFLQKLEGNKVRRYILGFTGMSVGWTNQPSEKADAFQDETEIVREVGNVKSVKMMGINCAYCHTGELSKGNQSVTILGAPSKIDIRALYTDLYASTIALFVKPDLMQSFLLRVKQQNPHLVNLQPERDAKKMYLQFKRELGQATLSPGLKFLDLRLRKIKISALSDVGYYVLLFGKQYLGDKQLSKKAFRKAKQPLINAYRRLIEVTHGLGPQDDLGELDETIEWFGNKAIGERPHIKETPNQFGRIDAFGFLGNGLIRGENPVNLNAPVALPWVWGTKYMAMKHYTANMNSAVIRNFGAAMAVGATYNKEKNRTSVNLRAAEYLENFMYNFAPPNWKNTFERFTNADFKINPDKAKKGKLIYQQNCMSCHETNKFIGPFKNLRDYKVYPLIQIGTDPNAARNVVKPVRGEAFAQAAYQVVTGARESYYFQQGVTLEEQDRLNSNLEHGTEFIRDTYLGFNDQQKLGLDYGNLPIGSGYKARHLSGAWASGPFLHNDSIPTLFELLQPVSKRPRFFTLSGKQDFDPRLVGVVTKRPNKCSKDDPFEKCIDTTISGNSNLGHEYGVTLSNEDKFALIEYLKILPPEPEYNL